MLQAMTKQILMVEGCVIKSRNLYILTCIDFLAVNILKVWGTAIMSKRLSWLWSVLIEMKKENQLYDSPKWNERAQKELIYSSKQLTALTSSSFLRCE